MTFDREARLVETAGSTPVGLDAVLELVVRVGVVEVDDLVVTVDAGSVWRETERLAAALRGRHAGREPARIAELQPARDLYKRIGEDPTRTRPSSEALLRRVTRDLPLPRVNALVDLGNWCSLDFLLPIGLYDVASLSPPVTIRLGQAGESYPSLAKGEFRVEGRVVVADAGGPCGNPTSDSVRTRITEATRRALMLIFAPADHHAAAGMAAYVATAAQRLEHHLGARVWQRQVLGGGA